MNSDTEEQAVDATYRVTGAHRSAYDRTTAEAHDVALAFPTQGLPSGWLKPPLQTSMQAGPGPCAGQGTTPGVLRAAGYRSGARRADRDMRVKRQGAGGIGLAVGSGGMRSSAKGDSTSVFRRQAWRRSSSSSAGTRST